MKIALMMITDGRQYLWETLRSLWSTFDRDLFDFKIILSDSQSWAFRSVLDSELSDFIRDHAPRQRGFAGQIIRGWEQIPEDIDYIFHMEDDFIFLEKPDLMAMAAVLEANPHLFQMALLRGPVNESEHAAGGIIEQHPEDFKLVTNGTDTWREHRKFFTTNPCLYRRSVIERGWPNVPNSEGIFGVQAFAADPDLRSAFWGTGVSIDHIGHVRSGTGY